MGMHQDKDEGASGTFTPPDASLITGTLATRAAAA
jgi:hypothetical protein